MPKRSFGPPPQQDEENHGVYDPDDYNATGDYQGSGADPYEHEDLADQEANPNDYSDSIGTRGSDEEQRKLALNKKGGGEDNHASMYNPNGDHKPGGAAANMAMNTAARELGPAGTIAKKAVEMLGRGKKGARGTITGIVAALCMIGIFAGVNNYANHFLNHITQVVDQEVGKLAKHEEQKVVRSVTQRMVNKATERAKASAEEKQKADEERSKAKEEGRAVSELGEAAVIATSTPLQQLLKDAGLELKFNANGEIESILDSTGKDVGEQIAKEAPSVKALIDQEWDISKLYSQRTTWTFHSGSSFNIFPEDGSQDKNPKKAISDAIENGASAEQIKMAETETRKDEPSNADEATKNSIADAEEKAKLIKDVTDAADKEFKESNDGAAAKEAGVKAGFKSINKIGNTLSVAAIATTACTVKEGFRVAADERVRKLTTLAIRNWSTLKSAASEENAGRLSSSTVNKMSLLYMGNKALLDNKDGSPAEGSLPATRSAAWHRASHVAVDSNPKSPYYTPDVKPSVIPTRSGPTKLVDTIQKYLNGSGLEFACDALTSKGGFLVQTGLTAWQVVANIGSIGTAQAALLVAGVAFNVALETEILPEIPALFGTLGATGTNTPVENLNNAEIGGNVAYKDYARTNLGAVPVSDAAAKQANDVADAEQLRDKQGQPWAYRTFAMSNPQSLVSKLIMRIPIDTQASIASMGSYFANFPFTIMNTLSSIFTPPSVHAASSKCASDPHCITGYLLSDSIIDRYSKNGGEDNENYLFGTISYNGNTIKRIDALGNPNKYSPSPAGDTNNDDLLHCFVNGYEQLAYESDGSNDATRANCGTMGDYDMEAHPPQAPDDNTVAGIYCKALGSSKGDSSCMSSVKGQMGDDFNRYCVYLAFSTVARTYLYASKITDS